MRLAKVLALLGLIVAIAFTGSLLIGPAALGWQPSLHALFFGDNEATRLVMREIRLPRAILGASIGATLGLSGAALQGYLRNPLADPGVLGISASASFGAVLAVYFGAATLAPLTLPLSAIAGAAVAAFIVRILAGRDAGTLTLILAGVAVSSLAGAMTTLALNLAPSPFAALEIVFWMLGSLNDRSMVHVWLALPFMAVGWIMLLMSARALDALTLGADVAATLGESPMRTQFLVVVGSAVAVGAATAVAGAIAFVGLIVPHLLRSAVGARPSRLLPASALGGAALVLLADIAVRVIAPERDIKLGVLTALIGAPFFLWLVLEMRREEL
ncbi:MAG: FecCD family ABC transporter permease [Hyphomicrobiaceae bacterium]